ncbi:hypothetical protein [Pseudonocardia parietis]|uniref:Superfamily III holin-X n=1 Tax=Pseudonocardia parietis TaxID=570936 RepID=A0ABS4W1C4_9PSEU|nr:hypothetical protein [Pseudonocardia parietis]MBP2369992.1 hypothetical protein [Pseudonocardia parietis]
MSTATPAGPDLGAQLRDAGGRLLAALIDRFSELALEKVDELAASLERVVEDGGVGLGAALGAGTAWARGRSPLWGALRGGFAAMGTAARILVGVVLAFAPILLVVGLLVVIVAALVWAVVAAVRAVVG